MSLQVSHVSPEKPSTHRHMKAFPIFPFVKHDPLFLHGLDVQGSAVRKKDKEVCGEYCLEMINIRQLPMQH